MLSENEMVTAEQRNQKDGRPLLKKTGVCASKPTWAALSRIKNIVLIELNYSLDFRKRGFISFAARHAALARAQ